jgi:DNA adenine methylase
LTDIQRAGRFFYLQKNCFGGLVVKRHYHYGVVQSPNFNPERLPAVIAKAHERLQRVQIESLPYQQILERYDRPTTCFYMDPPYWRRKLYRYNFSDQDFTELEQRLHKIRGRFLLSLDDHPEVRRLFGGWLPGLRGRGQKSCACSCEQPHNPGAGRKGVGPIASGEGMLAGHRK